MKLPAVTVEPSDSVLSFECVDYHGSFTKLKKLLGVYLCVVLMASEEEFLN